MLADKSKKITSLIMSTILIGGIATSVNYAIKKRNDYDGKTIIPTDSYSTTIEYDINDVINVDDEIIIEQEDKNEQESKVAEQDYREYIDSICKKKSYDNFSKAVITETVKLLDENYDSVQKIYKNNGMPSKSEYICNIFLKNLEENVDKITIGQSTELSKNMKNLYTNQGLYSYSDKEICIKTSQTNRVTLNICKRFLHEVTHADQHTLLDMNNTDLPEVSAAEWLIFTEGESSFMESTISGYMNYGSPTMFKNKSGEELYYFVYGQNVDTYQVYSKMYSMLLTLTDYDTMSDYKDTRDLTKIKEKINKNYGVDCSNILKKMIDVTSCAYYQETDQKGDYLQDIDTFYFDCLNKKIDNISSKKESEDMLNLYRYTKLQYHTRIIQNCDETRDVTNEYMDNSKYESILYDKLMQYGAFPNLFVDKEMSREIFSNIIKINKDKASISLINENIDLSELNAKISDDKTYINLVKDGNVEIQYNTFDGSVNRYSNDIVETDTNIKK